MLKSYRNITGLIIVFAFIVVTLFGLNMGMDARQDGSMSGCMFDQSVTCPMNYEEHINHWQQTFIAVQPTQSALFVLLILLFAIGYVILSFTVRLHWQRYAQEAHFVAQSVHKQREIIAKLFNHILQTLSNGILNPKLYNFSHTVS